MIRYQTNRSLRSLNKKAAQDVSRYLAKMTATECSIAMEQWLQKISEELEFLSRRREEVEREKEEFLNRVKGVANRF